MTRLRLTRSVLLDEILVNARAAVPLPALVERGPHQDAQTAIGLRVRGLRSTARGVEAARRDLQVLTELRDRELGLLRVDPGEHYAWCLAKKAAAFFRMSRSMRNSRLSLRSCASSARSSVVRPVRPFVRSARACRTQLRQRRRRQIELAGDRADRLAFVQDQPDGAGPELVRELPPYPPPRPV